MSLIQERMVSTFFLFFIEFVVVNITFLEIEEKHVTRPMNIIYAHNVIFLYTSSISCGTDTISVTTCAVVLRVTFDINEAGAGPYTLSAILVSLAVTDVFFNWFEFSIVL